MVHNHFLWASQIVGKSINVGKRTFSIAGGLDFGGDLCRGFGRLQLIGQGQRLLHKPKKLVVAWGVQRIQWPPAGGLRGIGRRRARVLFLPDKVVLTRGGFGGKRVLLGLVERLLRRQNERWS